MSENLNSIFVVQGVLCLWMGLLFLYGLKSKNMGIVDVGWSGGIAISSVIYLFLFEPTDPIRLWVASGLLILWSLRLSSFIFFKRVHGQEEDGRYVNLKAHWGKKANRNFFWLFFQAQAFLITLFMVPFFISVTNPSAVDPLILGAGILVWLIAVGGETLSDRQLTRWRENPENKGKTCRKGLWKYSRHPNYFFEWVHWWTYVILAIGSPVFFWSLLGPVLMFLFLYRVTGIPHTERQALKSRGDDYRNYQETTSAFFPWKPKT